ncbi:MAG: glycoside hydrolase family 76 protein [Saccharofermentanales bacterium]
MVKFDKSTAFISIAAILVIAILSVGIPTLFRSGKIFRQNSGIESSLPSTDNLNGSNYSNSNTSWSDSSTLASKEDSSTIISVMSESNASNLNSVTSSSSGSSDETDKDSAMILYELIRKDFSAPNTDLLKYFFPTHPNEKEYAYMWPYIQAHALANTMVELDPSSSAYTVNLKKIIGGLENYRSTFSDEVCYQSYPLEFGGGDTFYDDNIWVALELYRSYKLLGDPSYLEIVKGVFDYVKEANCNIMTTCTNAPTVIMAARLYNETGNADYLEWSVKIYDWVKDNLLAENGLFWDHLMETGGIEKTTWTYNTGMMISAAVELYKATGEEQYRTDALAYAKAAYTLFPKSGKIENLRVYPDTPWFNLLLLRGYIDLATVTGDSTYVKSMQSNLDYAWENSRDEDGYIYPNLNGTSQQSRAYRSLLDQASYAESFALVYMYNK